MRKIIQLQLFFNFHLTALIQQITIEPSINERSKLS
jgi:hypothetical protein